MFISKRPFLIRAFNAFNYKVDLDADRLLEKAIKKTGLNDFGDYKIKEALHQLIDSIKKEAKMHPFGLFITKERLLNVLQNRLRVEDYFKKFPEINDIKIQAPLIITGLQRTGTTRLHRLLAAHPNVRSLSSWEALNPAPIPHDPSNKKRIKFAKTAERALRFMSPDFFAIHPVEFEAPEEDVLLNDMTFISAVSEATMNVPSFSDWVKQQDPLIPYEYLKKILQLLQWQNPNEKWVLKTPEHLNHMNAIFKVFPDAKIIHTYRDPLKVIPSFSSMLFHSHRIFSNEIDHEKMTQYWMNKNAKMLQESFDFWEANESIELLHVSYYDMMQNLDNEVQRIIEFSNLEWNKNIKNSILGMDHRNKQHKYGVHKYSLEDFNLSREKINQTFQFYRNQFNIPYE